MDPEFAIEMAVRLLSTCQSISNNHSNKLALDTFWKPLYYFDYCSLTSHCLLWIISDGRGRQEICQEEAWEP